MYAVHASANTFDKTILRAQATAAADAIMHNSATVCLLPVLQRICSDVCDSC
jgi:hypothetical protein